jgi:hypothetical protein
VFLDDPTLELIGYQPNFSELEAGLFLFQHNTPDCGTSLAIEAGRFSDLYDGPIFTESLRGTDKCCGYCVHQSELRRCPAKCECAYVREILQIIRQRQSALNDTVSGG